MVELVFRERICSKIGLKRGKMHQAGLDHPYDIVEVLLVATVYFGQGDGVEVKVENVQRSIATDE